MNVRLMDATMLGDMSFTAITRSVAIVPARGCPWNGEIYFEL